MLDNFTLPWGNKVYNARMASDFASRLREHSKYMPSVLNTKVRKKEITLLLDGMFMVWVAMFMDEIEPEQLDWIDSMPSGSVLYDVGASIGAYTTYAALSEVECFAFEPEAQNFSALELHHFLNASRMKFPITSFNLAVSDRNRLDKIFCETYEKGSHRKVLGEPGFIYKHRQSVMSARLDDEITNYKLPYPEYLKIDVDGSELRVLRGAGLVLASPHLKEIFIELPEGDIEKEACKIIESNGFVYKLKKPVEAYENIHNFIFERR